MNANSKHAALSGHQNIEALASIADTLPGVVIVLNLQTLGVEYMNQRGLNILNTSLDDIIALGEEYHQRYFNPRETEEQINTVQSLLEVNDPNQIFSLFQQVRPTPKHQWEWYQSSLKIFSQDSEGKPLQIIAFSVPIQPDYHLTSRLDDLLNEKVFFQENLEAFSSLTKRERQILSHLAQGKTNKEIAEELYISIPTMETHKRNIKEKLGTKSSSELLQFANAFSFVLTI